MDEENDPDMEQRRHRENGKDVPERLFRSGIGLFLGHRKGTHGDPAPFEGRFSRT
ncbi:hypothetical protein AB0942_25610 [Streptomyces nodosus]|uniref:hypothetical protein n=1 Tax=Streptomyces nodosus TaxID=40318 RepID=UPI0034529F4C